MIVEERRTSTALRDRYLYPDICCKLLCSIRSSLRADRLVEKSTGRDVNWFQLRSSFSRKDREKNACREREGQLKKTEKDRHNNTITPSFFLRSQTTSILFFASFSIEIQLEQTQHFSLFVPPSLILLYIPFLLPHPHFPPSVLTFNYFSSSSFSSNVITTDTDT